MLRDFILGLLSDIAFRPVRRSRSFIILSNFKNAGQPATREAVREKFLEYGLYVQLSN